MSGHSHWSTIKFKKAAIDNKRGKLWSKIARMIIVAAKAGGGDPAANLTLRYAIDKAKSANMPKDTIEKAVKKGTGELGGVSYEEVLYEGYAPGGVAVMLEGLTDNRARTAPEIKKIFERRGGSLGASGCVGWMFSKKGVIGVKTSAISEDELMDIALSAGADDMQNTGELFEITCAPSAYEQIKKTLADKKIPVEMAELSMIPQNRVEVTDPEIAQRLLAMMDEFEDHDDIQEVYANFDIPEEILARIQK
jgi:YebC/PmpR family DNA-binding regulatory protein